MNFKDSYVENCPAIYEYNNAINNSENIVKIIEKLSLWAPAGINSNNEISKERSCLTTHINSGIFYNYEEIQSLYKNIWSCVNEYAINNKFIFNGCEDLQILKYETSDNFYNDHYDFSPQNNRIVSAIAYLNTVDVGGETYFKKFNYKVTPEENKIVVFPSGYAYTHSALPPISGVKYAAVFWAFT